MRNVTLTKVDGFTAFRTVRHGWLDRCSRMGYNSKWQPTDRCLLYSDQPEHRSVFDVTGTPDQCHEPLCVTWKFFSKRASKAYKILSVFRRDNHTRNGMRTIASIIKTETESQVIFLCKIRRKKKIMFHFDWTNCCNLHRIHIHPGRRRSWETVQCNDAAYYICPRQNNLLRMLSSITIFLLWVRYYPPHSSYSIFVRAELDICFAGGSALFVTDLNCNRTHGMEEL